MTDCVTWGQTKKFCHSQGKPYAKKLPPTHTSPMVPFIYMEYVNKKSQIKLQSPTGVFSLFVYGQRSFVAGCRPAKSQMDVPQNGKRKKHEIKNMLL